MYLTPRMARSHTDCNGPSTRTYRVMLRPIQAGDFSVVTGVGGLIMEIPGKHVMGRTKEVRGIPGEFPITWTH